MTIPIPTSQITLPPTTPKQPPDNITMAKIAAMCREAGISGVTNKALGLPDAPRKFGDGSTHTEAWLGKYLGSSEAVKELKRKTRVYSAYSYPCFIYGQSGSGKEIVARALHGDRKGKFVPLNCAAVTESLLESELFGHEVGSFSGASVKRQGIFAAAKDGTVFLDEIGEMPLQLQAKLLRTLQEKTVRPVGSNVEEPISCRVVCATHQDIKGRVVNKTFRNDLYYRLTMTEIFIPTFAHRMEDALIIYRHLLGLELDEEFPPNVTQPDSNDLAWGGVRYLQRLALDYRINILHQPAYEIDILEAF